MKVLVVIGTRPEAIKMAAVIRTLRERSGFEVVVCLTAQHRELLDQVIRVFDLPVHYDLNLMRQNQTIFDIT
ncbi:MAG: UDP-N-acetylglucosamine 2-epimerase (non-hydrolyzing), partial [Candidatus Hydrogenedentes bacterium]|nr:UDP-N-acetylglucosamine 2-epimerase (non-hydrolyzing) [Candidatus Hydrogenedentota bacterium]